MFDKVRNSCRTVSEKSEKIKIDFTKINEYALSLPINDAISPELDSKTHFLGKEEDTVAFFLILDSINFGSGYFPKLNKRPDMSGYFTVASSLTDLFRNEGPLSAERLSQLTTQDCTSIFNQDSENEDIQELMQLFTTALNELGNYLINEFKGSFMQLIKMAEASAEKLLKILIEMPFFNDVEPYGDRTVHFYKRAQLTAADLSIALKGQGAGCFNDLDRLTIFADNLVPHVLRIDEILIYDEALASRIDAGELIPSKSKEEVEIRACAVHAVELIKKELKESGYDVTSLGLDYLLWNRGQQRFYKKIKPRHRTRTVFY